MPHQPAAIDKSKALARDESHRRERAWKVGTLCQCLFDDRITPVERLSGCSVSSFLEFLPKGFWALFGSCKWIRAPFRRNVPHQFHLHVDGRVIVLSPSNLIKQLRMASASRVSICFIFFSGRRHCLLLLLCTFSCSTSPCDCDESKRSIGRQIYTDLHHSDTHFGRHVLLKVHI